MNTYQFTRIVDGPDLRDHARSDELIATGCGDAVIGVAGSMQYLDFDGEAPSLGAPSSRRSQISKTSKVCRACRTQKAGPSLITDLTTHDPRHRRTRGPDHRLHLT